MKLLNGIKKIYKNLKGYLEKKHFSFSFNSKIFFLSILSSLGISCCSIAFSFSMKTLTTSRNLFCASYNEKEVTSSGSSIINYSYYFDDFDKPMCAAFAQKYFNIDISSQGLDHGIYCYGSFSEETSLTIESPKKIISSDAESIFISDLGYFFNKPSKLIKNNISSTISLIRISVSKSIADKILNFSEKDKHSPDEYDALENTILTLKFRDNIIKCLIYSVVLDTAEYYSNIFKKDLVCIHDTEIFVNKFNRIITLPCGKYRNEYFLDKIESNISKLGNSEIYFQSTKGAKIVIPYEKYFNDYRLISVVNKIVLPVSLIGLISLMIYMLFGKIDLMYALLTSLSISLIFELLKLFILNFGKNCPAFLMFTSSVLFEISVAIFYGVYLFLKEITEEKNEKNRQN